MERMEIPGRENSINQGREKKQFVVFVMARSNKQF